LQNGNNFYTDEQDKRRVQLCRVSTFFWACDIGGIPYREPNKNWFLGIDWPNISFGG